MLVKNMRRHDIAFGPYRRADDEVFTVTGRIWESPAAYDYWMGVYEAKHADWGVFRMSLTIPKSIANSISLAMALLGGAPLEQVKSELTKARADGRLLIWCPSTDGWTLLG